MKELGIENREKKIDDDYDDFFMVDLTINGETINTGVSPVESYTFWDDLEDEVQRALYRIKTNNPKMSFDFSLASLAMSDEEQEKRYIDHIQEKHPDVDVGRVFELANNEIGKMELTGPDDNHPNPYIKTPIKNVLIKNLIVCVLEEYTKKND